MTRCRVGIKLADGRVRSMYVHCDGYPEKPGVGWEVTRSYGTVDKINALVDRGELAGLEATLEASAGYKNARGPVTHPIDDWPETGQEHEYLWDGERWLYRTDGRSRAFGMGKIRGGAFRPLSEVLAG